MKRNNVLLKENKKPRPRGLPVRISFQTFLRSTSGVSKNMELGTLISMATLMTPATRHPMNSTPKRPSTGKKAWTARRAGLNTLSGRQRTAVDALLSCALCEANANMRTRSIVKH